MKKTLLIIGAIAAAVYFIISALKGTLNPFKWFVSVPADDCLAKNKLKNDGEDCIQCVSSTVRVSGAKGKIKGGICVPIEEVVILQESYQLKVTNPNGAKVYQLNNGQFTAAVNTTVIPFNSTVTSTQLITFPATYYKIGNNQWLSANDVGKI